MLKVIAFDADDTLWHSECLYNDAQIELEKTLARHGAGDIARQELFATETRNMPIFGYGAKAFGLSMIETAIRLTKGQITASEIQHLLDYAKRILSSPVQLLDHAKDVVTILSQDHTLMLITKGDLLHQEAKIIESGLAPYFRHIEIVSTKNEAVYRGILEKHEILPQEFLMIGNSLVSDVLPVVSLGGYGIHIPYDLTWEHEHVDLADPSSNGHIELEHMGQLLPVIAEIGAKEPQS